MPGDHPPCLGHRQPLWQRWIFAFPCSTEGWRSGANILLGACAWLWSSLRHSSLSAAHNLSHLRQSPTVPAHSQLFQWKMSLILLICLSPRLQLRLPGATLSSGLMLWRRIAHTPPSKCQVSSRAGGAGAAILKQLELRNWKWLQGFLHILVVATQATKERGWKSTDSQATASLGLDLGSSPLPGLQHTEMRPVLLVLLPPAPPAALGMVTLDPLSAFTVCAADYPVHYLLVIVLSSLIFCSPVMSVQSDLLCSDMSYRPFEP